VDQIGCGVNEIKYTVNWLIPISKKILFIFNGSKINDSINAIYSARNNFFIVQCANLFFTIFFIDINEFAYSLKS